MKILNLNESRFEDSELWRAHSTAITSIDPTWHQRSLKTKITKLLRISKGFDVVIFHLDMRLAAIYGLIQGILPSKQYLIFQGLFCDISRYSSAFTSLTAYLRKSLSLLLHRVLVHTMNAVVVHTRAEVALYSKFFNVRESRFVFVPYFHYGGGNDDGAGTSIVTAPEEHTSILAIGRHRDFACFIRAMTGSAWQGVIVAGDSDRDELTVSVPPNVTIRYEVSRTEYRDYIAKSTIVVIPLYANRWQRALGQIAMFEAMLRHKPIVAAETFQLADYASNNEVLYYRPGDAEHLREQLGRLLKDADLRCRLTDNAHARLLREFTRERYIAQLIGICQTRNCLTNP